MINPARLPNEIRKTLYHLSVRYAVYRSNIEINKAFAVRGVITPKRAGMVAGFASMAIFAFAIIGYAVTGPIDHSIDLSGGGAEERSTFMEAQIPRKVDPVTAEQEAKIASVAPLPLVDLSPEIQPDSSTQEKSVTEQEKKSATGPVAGSDLFYLPKPVLSMPVPATDSRYTFVVDKKNFELYVLEENRENYRIVEVYPVSLGAKKGDKVKTGDLKTPEGLYQIVRLKNDEELPARYGPMAFVLNYPNDLDKQLNKTGYGIWIHGSGLGVNTKPTEGCVEVNDLDIVDLKKYVEVGTPVFIYPEGFTVPHENGVIQKHLVKPDTLYALKEQKATMEASVGSRLTIN